MEELKDYSGPFRQNVKYEDFSKDVLVKLLKGYSDGMNVLNMLWMMEVRKRLGDDATKEILLDVWRAMGPVEMGCPMKAANIEGNDVETYCKINQLVPSFAHDVYKYEFDVKNKNHAILTVWECPAYIRRCRRLVNWTCWTGDVMYWSGRA